jgi:dermatan 4-sulfotransferase 1
LTPLLRLQLAAASIGLAPPVRAFIVVPKLKLAFGRVPKVANSSIKIALARHVPVAPDIDERPGRDQYWIRAGDGSAHMASAAAVLARTDGFLVFAFVRDPFDRLASCYVNKILKAKTFPPLFAALGLAPGMSFDAFTGRVAEIPDAIADDHFRSQSAMLIARGAVVPRFVGRFERIGEDWERLRRAAEAHCGIDLGELPHVNNRRGGADDLADLYRDKAVAARVRARYARDFEVFYPERADPR